MFRINVKSAYGLIGFVIAVAIHIASYIGPTMDSGSPLFFAMHGAIFPLFFLMVFRMQGWSRRTAGLLGMHRQRLQWRQLLPYFPAPVRWLGIGLFVYAFVNFFIATSHMPSASHSVPGGADSAETMRWTVRAFSGHWMLFYLMPTLFFGFVPEQGRLPDTSPQQ